MSLQSSFPSQSASPSPVSQPETNLVETYLNLIQDRNRRLAVHAEALRAGRDRLATMPAEVADLQSRLAVEIDAGTAQILRDKLAEAKSELEAMAHHMERAEARWPERREELLTDIKRYRAKLKQLGHVAA